MNIGLALFRVLVFPGLLYAIPMAWLMLWIERKIMARMQGRIGPPFYQPFYDFIKLMTKRLVKRPAMENLLMTGLPILASGSLLGALALLPVFLPGKGFAGDLVLLITLLEVAPLCLVLAGFSSGSIFGQVGATREAVLMVVYNIPFLTALVALAYASGSLNITEISLQPFNALRLLVVLVLILCLPAKLRITPFSIGNAEQEIYSGPLTEFGGPRLAFWKLAHGLEWVTLISLIICLSFPLLQMNIIMALVLFVIASLVLVFIMAGLAAVTARLKLIQAVRLYWRWGLVASMISLLLAIWMI